MCVCELCACLHVCACTCELKVEAKGKWGGYAYTGMHASFSNQQNRIRYEVIKDTLSFLVNFYTFRITMKYCVTQKYCIHLKDLYLRT